MALGGSERGVAGRMAESDRALATGEYGAFGQRARERGQSEPLGASRSASPRARMMSAGASSSESRSPTGIHRKGSQRVDRSACGRRRLRTPN